HAVLVQVVDEAAAVGLAVGRPAEAVEDLAGLHAAGGQLPELLDADRIILRVRFRVQAELADQLLGQVAARAFGHHGHLGPDVDALGVTGLVRPVPGHAHVADAHAADGAGLVEQGFGGGEAGVDLHPQGLGL